MLVYMGNHTFTAYYKWGLTSDLFKLANAISDKFAKSFLINPNILYALFILLCLCWSNFSLLSKMTLGQKFHSLFSSCIRSPCFYINLLIIIIDSTMRPYIYILHRLIRWHCQHATRETRIIPVSKTNSRICNGVLHMKPGKKSIVDCCVIHVLLILSRRRLIIMHGCPTELGMYSD